MAGIPNAPSVYSTNEKIHKKRHEKVLKSLVEFGYMTEKEVKKLMDK